MLTKMLNNNNTLIKICGLTKSNLKEPAYKTGAEDCSSTIHACMHACMHTAGKYIRKYVQHLPYVNQKELSCMLI